MQIAGITVIIAAFILGIFLGLKIAIWLDKRGR